MSQTVAPDPAYALVRPSPAARRRHRARRRVWPRVVAAVDSLLLLGCLLMFLGLGVGPHVFGYRTATMLTGSMAPGIEPGDVVVTVPRPAADVAVGDVISYHIPIEDHRVETHRVVEVVQNDDGTTAVRTKGDANESADPWTATLEGDTVYEEVAVIPRLGAVIRTLRSPYVLYAVFWIGVGGLVVMGLWSIWRDGDGDERDLDDEEVDA